MLRLVLAAAAVGVALWAGTASAQSFTDICGRYDAPYGKLANSSDLRALEAGARAVPNACGLHGQIAHRLEVVRAKNAANAAAAKKAKDADDSEAPDTHDTVSGDDQLAMNSPPAPPAVPADPCSVAGVDALDPSIPADGPPLGLPASKRADLAQRYTARALAFDKCSDLPDAQQYFSTAVETDPQSFVALSARARFELGQGDAKAAITDETAAIGQASHAPTDVNVLTAYADRAAAYDRLQMLAQEAQDLKAVDDHYNDHDHSSLAERSVYKERLAKTYLRLNDDADAEDMFARTEEKYLDWEDQWFLGGVEAAASHWDEALDRFDKALAMAPADAGHAPLRSQIEVAIGKVYQGRGHDGDMPTAYAEYKKAADEDLGNKDALALLDSLGTPLAPPTFTEPELQEVPMPAGVSNLAADRPPPFCGQPQKNDYLNTVRTASGVIIADIQTLAARSDELQQEWNLYDANKLLTYREKVEDEKLIDDERQRLTDKSMALHTEGDALIAFYNRINADGSLVVYCQNGSAGR